MNNLVKMFILTIFGSLNFKSADKLAYVLVFGLKKMLMVKYLQEHLIQLLYTKIDILLLLEENGKYYKSKVKTNKNNK